MGHLGDDIIRAIIGGAIIAVASSLHLLVKGRITGISGIFYSSISKFELGWELYFIFGLLYIANIFTAFFKSTYFDPINFYEGDLSIIGFLLCGFLIGFGSKMANGCESGHGICGLPRFSKRSIVAVILFVGCAIPTAIFRHKVSFLNSSDLTDFSNKLNNETYHYVLFGILTIIFLFIGIRFVFKKLNREAVDLIVTALIGMLFGLGLIISGLAQRTKVLHCLDVTSDSWDPSFLIILGTAIVLNLIFFNLILRFRSTPLLYVKMSFPEKTEIDLSLVIGAIIFGIGWGLGGISPGPAFIGVVIYLPHLLFFIITLAAGMWVAKILGNNM